MATPDGGFFTYSFWQLVAAEVVSRLFDLIVLGLMSATAITLYTRVKRITVEWKDVIIWWTLLTFFLVLVSVRFAQAPPPTQTIELWPAGLTKGEIDKWADALEPYRQKVGTVMIVYGDYREANFAASLTQAIGEADWPEPSVIPNQFIMGARISATKDAWTPAQLLQKLIETKTGGPIRLDHYPERDQSGKPNTKVIAVYAGLKPIE